MKRRYIGIEMGPHAESHCQKRLVKVVDGEQGGISAREGWSGGGGFRFYRLGSPVFDDAGHINAAITFPVLAAHIWFAETGLPYAGAANSPLLGVHEDQAYYLLFNGILGDKTVNGGNVLTTPVLGKIPPFDGQKIIFGASSRLGSERLQRERITFRQIPYEMKVR